ncbi:MAG: hypothetical protein QGH20_10420, partial [Candidatus Latescibacteria bacterium]|nr:hypothetical protein [Candidatus Latescibacterota bacterium]
GLFRVLAQSRTGAASIGLAEDGTLGRLVFEEYHALSTKKLVGTVFVSTVLGGYKYLILNGLLRKADRGRV